MSKTISIKRICRLDGQQPTRREKWKAFWGLWRMADKNDKRRNFEEQLRILMADWSWLRLAESYESFRLVNTSRTPKFLRRDFVRLERGTRLFGSHSQERDYWRGRFRCVQQKLRGEGKEMTLEEVATHFWLAMPKIWEGMIRRGVDVPADVREFARQLSELARKD